MGIQITAVEVFVTCPSRNFVIVRIRTNQDGLTGLGDATLNGRELAVVTTLEQHLAPLLVGRDPQMVEDIWQEIFRGTYWRGGPVLMTALSAIDTALWDIKGKIAGQPLYQLLGGRCRNGALAYTHVAGNDFAEVADRIRAQMARGYRALRAQVVIPGNVGTYGVSRFLGEADDLPKVERWEPRPYLRTIPKLFEYLRKELGDEVELLHDIHERLTPTEAADLARRLEPYDLFFLEDAVRPEHRIFLDQVRSRTTIPLSFGELLFHRWDVLPLLQERLVDYIRCDINHAGGITELKKIAVIAETYGVRTAWHGPPDMAPIAHAANVHLDLATPNFGIQEYIEFPPEVYEVFPGGPEMQDGYLDVSERPGLGVDFDEVRARDFPYTRSYLPMVRRQDGSVHDW